MTPEIKKLEDSIKRSHRVAFTPKFKHSFETKLSKSAFIAIALKAIEKIGWDLIYYDDQSVEAKRKNSFDTWTESVTMNYDFGKVVIKSTSLGNELWDFGRNSVRVRLFQLVFQDHETSLSNEEIKEYEIEQKKVDEWDEYEIPESLPSPSVQKRPNIYVPLISSVIVSLILGYFLAFSISSGFYIIGLFDIGVGFILGFVLHQTLKLGNYTHFDRLRYILLASVILAFLSCQLFIYQIALSKNPLLEVDFISFMKLRMDAGLTIKHLNTGWIGLLISWGLLLVLGYYTGLLKLATGTIKYQLSRVPPEVMNYAIFLFIKGNDEIQVRKKISQFGWAEPHDQDCVMEAVAAIQSANEIRRS
ncbi:MAG: hypothetical protein COA38_16595 [Fluviicola sp.]|nr:MAG: hypothetical protein COA38_16595 [Fluviicola sp.]